MLGKFLKRIPKRVYLDYAAATPMSVAVRRVVRDTEMQYPANPSAIHSEGVLARQVIESARERLARLLVVRPDGIVFTGSGTESNNLAIIGTVHAQHAAGVAYSDMEVVTTKIEHPSVLEAVKYLERLGVASRYIEVNETGQVELDSLRALLSKKTVLVTLAYVNSEIGTIQSLGKISRLIRAHEKEQGISVVLHADGAQAPLWLPCALNKVPVDILTLDAGKCCGPKGVGVVALRHGITLAPVLFGGPQEGGVRPATENTPGILGAVEAIVRAQDEYEKIAKRTAELRDTLLEKLLQLDDVVLNGANSGEGRVANNINISVLGIDSEFAVISLDEAGIACSTKSACSGAGGGESVVVSTICGDTARATSTLRFTLGPDLTQSDIDFAATKITAVITKLQAQQKKLTF